MTRTSWPTSWSARARWCAYHSTPPEMVAGESNVASRMRTLSCPVRQASAPSRRVDDLMLMIETTPAARSGCAPDAAGAPALEKRALARCAQGRHVLRGPAFEMRARRARREAKLEAGFERPQRVVDVFVPERIALVVIAHLRLRVARQEDARRGQE